jgi:LTXXQ motif family protein
MRRRLPGIKKRLATRSSMFRISPQRPAMKILHAFIVSAVAAISLGTASAQHMGGSGFGRCMGTACVPGTGIGSLFGDATVVAQARLDVLHARLGITAAQEAAWQAYATRVLEQADLMDDVMASMFLTTGTAAQRMTAQAGLVLEQAQAFAAAARAFNDLYALFTPEQRLIADGQWGLGMGVGMGRGY